MCHSLIGNLGGFVYVSFHGMMQDDKEMKDQLRDCISIAINLGSIVVPVYFVLTPTWCYTTLCTYRFSNHLFSA